MANVCNDGGGRRRVQFIKLNGSRSTLRLGKVDLRTARVIAGYVEELVNAKRIGRPVSSDTVAWVSSADPQLREKMEKIGLIEGAVKVTKPTLRDLMDTHYFSRGDVKASTKSTRRFWANVIVELLGSKPCDQYDSRDAAKLRAGLESRGIAKPTVARMLRFARQVFTSAILYDYIERNPLDGLKYNYKESKLPDRDYLSIEDFDSLTASLPIPWKLLASLARYGALRSPSETLLLRWSDVRLEDARQFMEVSSPKTEAEGKSYRVVAIHHRLADLLRFAKESASSDYVVDLPAYRKPKDNGAHGVNPRQHFYRLLTKAGMKPPRKAFKVFRSSCLSDWANKLPLARTAAMCGNTVAVAGKHYLTARDVDLKNDFDAIQEIGKKAVAQKAAQSLVACAGCLATYNRLNPEKIPPISLVSELEKAAQKAAQSESVPMGKSRYIANSCNTQVLVVPELTHPYLLVPAITIYPARIRT